MTSNWPLIEESIGFAMGPGTPTTEWITPDNGANYYGVSLATSGLFLNLTSRTEGSWTCTRGRQYELDQVQAGTASSTMNNIDGALDPSNVSSPFYPQVKMYRAYRRRAQYPSSKNLLSLDQVTGGNDPSGAYGANMGRYVTPSSAFPISFLGNTPPGSSGQMVEIGGWAVTPGVSHAAQMNWYSTAASISYYLQFRWYDVHGSLISTTNGGVVATGTGGAGATATVVGTPPAGCAGATIAAVMTGGPSVSSFVQWNVAQVELGSSVTSYATPGTWHDLFTGFINGWPQTWDGNGTYGVSNLSVTDAFGYLSQHPILSPGYQEILAAINGVQFGSTQGWFFPLDEATNSTQWLDLTGNLAPMQQRLLNAGVASQCTAGNQMPTVPINKFISTGFGYTRGFQPTSIGGPVTSFSNDGHYGAAVLDLGAAKQQIGPGDSGAWSMVFMVYMPATATPGSNTDLQTVWGCYNNNSLGVQSIELYGTPTSFYKLKIVQSGVTMMDTSFPSTGGYPANDGAWHLLIVTMSYDGKTVTLTSDTNSTTVVTNPSDMHPQFQVYGQPGWEVLGGHQIGYNEVEHGWTGSLACVGYIPADLHGISSIPLQSGTIVDSPSISNLVNTLTQNTNGNWLGSTGIITSDSGQRALDILRWGGWKGDRNVHRITPNNGDTYGPGTCWAYGSPSEFVADTSSTGTDVVSALQTVTDTENGAQYVDASGRVTFKLRQDRYNQSPTLVFGEGATGPYRTNLCVNPSFEVDVAGWTGGGATIAFDNTRSWYGFACAKITGANAAAAPGVTAKVPVTASAYYAVSAYLNPNVALGTAAAPLWISWFDNTNTLISTQLAPASTLAGTTGVWTRYILMAQAPSNAVTATFGVLNTTSLLNTEIIGLDNVLFEQTSVPGGYFDGSGSNGFAQANFTYAWTGTANESTSTMTAVEVPYTTVRPAFDPVKLVDDVKLTQTSSGNSFRKINSTAISDYGDVQLQRNVNTLNTYEINDGTELLLGRYDNAVQRIESITIDVAATNSWAAVLPLELGSVVRIMRRPPSPAPAITFDGFVEQIIWNQDEQGNASLTLQLSPLGNLQFWQLDSNQFGVLGVTTICGY